jgi:DNA modification methylase
MRWRGVVERRSGRARDSMDYAISTLGGKVEGAAGKVLKPRNVGGRTSVVKGEMGSATIRRGSARRPLQVETASRPLGWKSVESYAAGQGQDNLVWWKLLKGDSRQVLLRLPGQSINCVITSPPYYWQRDYGVKGQMGLEPTIGAYVENLITVFRALRPTLTKNATVFLNLGDTYYSAKGQPRGPDAKQRARRFGLRAVDASGLGLPRKTLIGIPWRVALALVDDGWTLRSAIVWVRNTAIPEPTSRDRPWRKYEFVFLLTNGPRYYFNRGGLSGEEDVWSIEPQRNSDTRGTHFAPFPKGLVQRCISAGCPSGGVVLDPFLGGGTTMSVALSMGRSAIGIELNAEYCDLVSRQLSELPPTQVALVDLK